MVKLRIYAKAEIEIETERSCSRNCTYLNTNEAYCFLFRKELFFAREEGTGPLILARCRSCFESEEADGERKGTGLKPVNGRFLDKEKVREMYKGGMTIAEISRSLGKSYSAVYCVVKAIQKEKDSEAA